MKYSLPSPSPSPRPPPSYCLSLWNQIPLGTSYEWNHTLCVLLCLASLTERHILEVHPGCSKWQDFPALLRLNRIPSHRRDIFFIHSPVRWVYRSHRHRVLTRALSPSPSQSFVLFVFSLNLEIKDPLRRNIGPLCSG